MASNTDRRNALLDTLEANAKAELDETVPDLINKADQGLRSLSKDDELSMITEIEGWDSDLVDKLDGLGWLGDQVRDGDDTNKQKRHAALDGLKDRLYNSVADARNGLDAKTQTGVVRKIPCA
jgi:hypothetical protein